MSPVVMRMTGSAAALASFRRSSEMLAELGAVTVRAKRGGRVAEALARETAAAESVVVFDCEPPAAPTMDLRLDRTGVPMRPKEVAGRAGKQADSAACQRRRAASSLATVPNGLGAWPANCSRERRRSWASTTQPRAVGRLPRHLLRDDRAAAET